MSRSRRPAEDHKFSHPVEVTKTGSPVRLSFSDARQLNKVDKNERRKQRLIRKTSPCEILDDPIADLLSELDCVQEKIAEIIGKKLAAYPVYLDCTSLPYYRVRQSKLLNCLTRIS